MIRRVTGWVAFILAAALVTYMYAPALPTWALGPVTLAGLGVAAFTSRNTITKEKP